MGYSRRLKRQTALKYLRNYLMFIMLLPATYSIAKSALQSSHIKQVPTQHCYVEGLSEQVQCGKVTVPENPAKPDGKKINIHYVILPAIKNSNHQQALLAIAGGPGQSAIEHAAHFNQMLNKVRQFRDILLIDQRGTGKSNPLKCEHWNAAKALAINDELQDVKAETRKCLVSQDADITQYASLNAIKDFEAVRHAAGYKKLDLYGISYGTRMAQIYMREYPDAINTVTLDAVVPMQQNLMYISTAISRALDKMLVDCQKDPSCNRTYPQLKQELAQIEQKLSQAPIMTQVFAPLSGENTQFTLTRSKFLGAIRMALYAPNTRSLLPYAIHQTAKGNYQPILGLYALTLDENSIATGMHASVICSEDIPFINDEIISMASSSFIGQQMLKDMQQICSVWKMPSVSSSFHQPITSDIPTLLLSGEQDPATPPAWAELAKVKLTNAKHFIAPYSGHGVAASSCASDLLTKLVKTGSLATLDDQCLKKDVSRNFYLNANTVESLTPEQN